MIDRIALTEELCALVRAPKSKTASWSCSKGANPYWTLKVGSVQYRFDWCGNTHPKRASVHVFGPPGEAPTSALAAMKAAIAFMEARRDRITRTIRATYPPTSSDIVDYFFAQEAEKREEAMYRANAWCMGMFDGAADRGLANEWAQRAVFVSTVRDAYLRGRLDAEAAR